MLNELPIRERIAYVARVMYERRLTDIAGGNISMREGDQIICTPRFAGSKRHWDLSPDDLVAGPCLTDDLVGHPSFTREGLSHLAVYRAFPFVRAIIHAHPRHVLPFCVLERPIQPVLKATQKYGTIGFISHAPNYSQEQADSIVANLCGQEERMQTTAAALLMPQHGIFLAGVDLLAVLDALDRIDTNAYCILAQSALLSLE